ncbi:MAG: SPFH domain-containing protein, partial [Chloroflexota bacterium]
MFLDTLLDLITKITWGIVIFVFVVSFARDVRRKGIGGALRNFISLRVLVLLLTLLSVTILSASLVFIPPQERGVVISILASGGVRENPMEAGLNWIVPLAEEVLTYPIHWQTYTMADRPLEGQVVGDDAIVAR